MGDSSFSLGGVYSAQLSVKIRLQNTDTYKVTGAKIKVYSRYSGQNDILRGVFWVTSVSRKNDIYTISASDSSSIRFTQAVFPKDMQQNKEAAKTPLARISFFIILLLWGNGFSAFPIILNEPCLKNMDLAEL